MFAHSSRTTPPAPKKLTVHETTRPIPLPEQEKRPFWREHGFILLVGVMAFAIRLQGLSRRQLIYDETLLLDPEGLGLGLIEFAQKLWTETTYNPGWPILIWLVKRVAGLSIFWARFPSALCGALAPLALYAVAREFGLKRITATLGALVMAVALHQVEYGQQIMPHGALPLGCCLSVWLVSRMGRREVWNYPGQMVALSAGLVAVFGTLIFLHNSTLLLVPLLLGYWLWTVSRPTAAAAGDDPRARRLAVASWVVCTAAIGFTSLGWFIAKSGKSDWNHLRPFFMGTFKHAPDRGVVSDSLAVLDYWYVGPGTPSTKLEPVTLRDVAYFTTTRIFDLIGGQFKLRGEQQYTLIFDVQNNHFTASDFRHFRKHLYLWLLPLGMVFLVGRGVFRALTGRAGPIGSRWVFVAGMTLVLLLALSAVRLFPLGGIRHLIVLSPLVILTAALGLESASRRVTLVLTSLCLAWMTASVVALPEFYRTTRDRLGFERLLSEAAKYGVKDFVAADTICSEGTLRLAAAQGTDCQMIPADSEKFAECTLRHRPFFICSLSDPILETTEKGKEPTPTKLLKQLAHPLANLRNYRAIQIAKPVWPKVWLDWTVWYLEPKEGPYSPEVAEVGECKRMGQNTAAALVVRFSKPMRADTINSKTIQLVSLGKNGFVGAPLLPIDVHYFESSQTAVITPREPLAETFHMLAMYRDIVDEDGRPLDSNSDAFFHLFTSLPNPFAEKSDRSWSFRAEMGFVSSKL